MICSNFGNVISLDLSVIILSKSVLITSINFDSLFNISLIESEVMNKILYFEKKYLKG